MSVPVEEIRRAFWQAALADERLAGVKTYQDTNAWVPVTADGSVILALGIQQDGSSAFLRGALNAGQDTARAVLTPHATVLSKKLSAPFEAEGDVGQGRYFRKRSKAAFTLRSQWPEIIRWFAACRARQDQILGDVLEARG